MGFFWARSTDMALISSCSVAARMDSPSRIVSCRAVALDGGWLIHQLLQLHWEHSCDGYLHGSSCG
jgi:hypothetical protein